MPWYFPLIGFSDLDNNPTNLPYFTYWKMSIEVILKAAEYIERRERGERHKFSVFWAFPLRLASRTSAEKILGLTKTWRARRRAWQIGWFELSCSLALTLTAGQAAVGCSLGLHCQSAGSVANVKLPVWQSLVLNWRLIDSLIFASVLLFVLLTWFDFVMCAFDDINIHIFWVVSGLIPYIML